MTVQLLRPRQSTVSVGDPVLSTILPVLGRFLFPESCYDGMATVKYAEQDFQRVIDNMRKIG
jgi:hypothetical protein